MLLVFQVCFFAGAGLAVISLILGNVFDFSGFDGIDVDIDFNLDIDGAGGPLLPISPLVIILFFTVFGGSGMILMNKLNIAKVLILILSMLIGAVISFLIHRLIFIPLKKAQNTSTPDADELIGALAKVNENIGKESFGEITYIINGNSYNAPAKSTDGRAIEKGVEVTICWIEQHVFYVIPIADKVYIQQ